MTNTHDNRVLVLGLGETGLSLVRWLAARGAVLRVADSRVEPPGKDLLLREFPGIELYCGAFNEALLQGVGQIALSPGISSDDPLVRTARARGIDIAGDIELWARERASAAPDGSGVIAITGANGKTTVTSMVGAMARAAGLDTVVAGNISPALLDAALARAGQPPQLWVLELSSFQLEVTSSLAADAAAMLNLSEDHLDRHGDMASYAAAKARIFHGGGVQVLNREDPQSRGMALDKHRVATFGLDAPQQVQDWGVLEVDGTRWLAHGAELLLPERDLQVLGQHNVANALAALALCSAADVPLAPAVQALRTFRGLPHRVEQVAVLGGVRYIDDSKGTNVGATVAALAGLGQPAVVILGGDGKGQDFTPLRDAVTRHGRAALLIGRDAARIATILEGCGVPVRNATDMADAVRQAAVLAQPGDAVLMSPACASFDMYRNYLQRAEAFVAAVAGLQREAA